jgi:hypothetical protein
MKSPIDNLSPAYASSEESLNDYFKSDVCKGRAIYCAFIPRHINMMHYRMWLSENMNLIQIPQISFKGEIIIKNNDTIKDLIKIDSINEVLKKQA